MIGLDPGSAERNDDVALGVKGLLVGIPGGKVCGRGVLDVVALFGHRGTRFKDFVFRRRDHLNNPRLKARGFLTVRSA